MHLKLVCLKVLTRQYSVRFTGVQERGEIKQCPCHASVFYDCDRLTQKIEGRAM